MDSDDFVEVDLYQKAIDECVTHQAELVVFGLQEDFYNKNGFFVRTIPFKTNNAVMNTAEEIRSHTMQLEKTTLLGYPWNKIYHLPTLRKTRSRFSKDILLEDFFFNINYMSQISSLVLMDYIGYHYIKRYGQGQTSRYIAEYFPIHYKKVKTLYDYHKEWRLLTDVTVQQMANLLVRYIFSALQRNATHNSKMTKQQQYEFLEDLYRDELFCTLIPKAGSNGMLPNMMARFLKRKNTRACFATVQMIRLTKQFSPDAFIRLKQKR